MSTTTAARQIIQDHAQGELPEAYWELVDRYRSELLNQACAMLGEVLDAEDTVQETFCEALTQPQRLAHVESLGAWLRTVNKRNALNKLRARRRDSQRKDRKQLESPQRTVTTGGFTQLELRESVTKAIETLPEKYREVIALRYWEGLGCDDIAARLSLPAGTVKWYLFEAANRLHGHLQSRLEQ